MAIAQVRNDKEFLINFLEYNNLDMQRMDATGFRRWLAAQIRYKKNDDVFWQRCQIRELRKKHRQQLFSLERSVTDTEIAYNASATKQAIEETEYAITGAEKAITGLSAAVTQRKGEKLQACQQKLELYRQKISELRQQYQKLLKNTPEKTAFIEAESKLEHFKQQIGLQTEELRLRTLLTEQSQRATASGSRYEDEVLDVVANKIIPQLGHNCRMRKQLRIISRVTLGCARAEIDHMVVRLPSTRNQPVQVQAIIEVKRNINDIAGGFAMRQENLHWFTGNSKQYDPQIYRTKYFNSGHFDRPAEHLENGDAYLFADKSFWLFQVDPQSGYFIDRLFFITQKRRLHGMSSEEHSKLLYRIASDVNFDLEDNRYIIDLLQWLQKTIAKIQTKDILEIYSKRRKWVQQFLMTIR